MPKIITRLSIVLSVLAVVAAGPVRAASDGPFAPPKSPYAADMVMQTQAHTVSGKVWRDGMKERREMTMQGQAMAIIVDYAAQKAIMLFPSQRSFMEQSRSEAQKFTAMPNGGDFRVRAIGKDEVSGEATTRYRIDGKDGAGNKFGGHMWRTPDRIIMRMIPDTALTGGKVVITLSNLRRGAQDPALFQVPKGWARMQMPAMPTMNQAQIDRIVKQMRKAGASQAQIDAFLKQMSRK